MKGKRKGERENERGSGVRDKKGRWGRGEERGRWE